MPDQAPGGGSHEEVTGKGTDSAVVWDELASTLVAVVASGSSREEIRRAVGPVCARVREERMDVAELVKAVKQVFAGAAGARLDGSERQQLLDRIISVCIDEYYAEG